MRTKATVSQPRENLMKTMEELKFNQRTLAAAAGIDRSTLAHIMEGRGTSVDIALAIAKTLNRSVEYLFLP